MLVRNSRYVYSVRSRVRALHAFSRFNSKEMFDAFFPPGEKITILTKGKALARIVAYNKQVKKKRPIPKAFCMSVCPAPAAHSISTPLNAGERVCKTVIESTQ